jgi:hypothetical protein
MYTQPQAPFARPRHGDNPGARRSTGVARPGTLRVYDVTGYHSEPPVGSVLDYCVMPTNSGGATLVVSVSCFECSRAADELVS